MLISLLCVILGGTVFYFLFFWVRELIFYLRNNWDFSKKFGPELYFGGEGGFTQRMTPKQKLFFGYPFLVFGFSILLVVVATIGF